MRVERVNESNRRATYELIFSHMSTSELKSFISDNATTHKHILDILNNKRGICLTAEEGDTVIGYLLADEKSNNASNIRYTELRDMRVKSEYQRKGIGSLLVEQFIQWAKDENCERLSVDVYALSEKNIGFYQKHGFAPKTLTMERWFN
jgi:GNAT superfamily N-acetyltransferase